MRIYFRFILSILFMAMGCKQPKIEIDEESNAPIKQSLIDSGTSLIVLGTMQDAGSPHIACKRECCAKLFQNPDTKRQVVSLGIVDTENNYSVLFEATPDISLQVKNMAMAWHSEKELPDAIFLTHAHIGHYTGLQYLGKEATNASEVPVYAMPRMKQFLETNGPWSQLVTNHNISLREMVDSQKIVLTSNISVTPFRVPHRDEYSETVGYIVDGPSKSLLFIPDIDKWDKWETSIIEAISKVDYAFLDATFYHGKEINLRDISEIPHPFMVESMDLFKDLSSVEKKKIYFIHFNHTNPVLNTESDSYKELTRAGFQAAKFHQIIPL